MNQELYQKAIKFAGEKHHNQTMTGSNSNYLLHISNVSMEVLVAYYNHKIFDINYAMQVAILHDTIEDTSTEFEEIKYEFGERIALGVLALTKDDSLLVKKDQMVDSLIRINLLEPEVGIVKIADRITNLQTPPLRWTMDKISNYLEEAKLIREALNDKNEFLVTRLKLKIIEYEHNISIINT